MNSIVQLFNRLFGTAVDFFVHALEVFSPFWGVVAFGAISGAILVYLWGKVSNQEKIRAVKQSMHARLLEAIVFRHDIGVSLKAQGGLFAASLVYLTCALRPLLILGIPCVLLMAQLNRYYGYEPLKTGEEALIDVKVSNESALDALSVSASATDLKVDGPVRMQKDGTALYRVEALTPGSHTLSIKSDSEPPQAIQVAAEKNSIQGIESVVSSDWLTELIHPTLRSVTNKNSPVESISVEYPAAEYRVFKYKLSWEVLFFGISIISGYVIGKVLGIEL